MFIKTLTKTSLLIFLLILIFSSLTKQTQAQTSSCDGTNCASADFIVGEIGHTHSLTTGEQLRFTEEGGPGPGEPVRQYKSSNWEQFYIGSDGTVYRGEDTSWAPLPGFGEAVCADGSSAKITPAPGCQARSNGQTITNDGIRWAPPTLSVGDTFTTQTHQLVPFNFDILRSQNVKQYCELGNLTGYEGTNACGQTGTLQVNEFYSKDTCPALEGAGDMLELEVIGGPGTGDRFCYMQGWGLVGFTAPGFSAGLAGGSADCGCTQMEPPSQVSYPIPCDQTTDDELHSLRPYGGSPCDGSITDLAMMCGNDLVTRQQVSVEFPEGGENCELINQFNNYSFDPDTDSIDLSPYIQWTERNWKCEHRRNTDPDTGEITTGTALQGTLEVQVDLEPAEFPIMGNTEDVTNLEQEDGFDFGQRMNNYVSWFLNGAVNRAPDDNLKYETLSVDEFSCQYIGTSCVPARVDGTCDEGEVANICSRGNGNEGLCNSIRGTCSEAGTGKHRDVANLSTDVNQMVNYSGPLNKLLPWRIIVEEKTQEANAGRDSVEANAGIRHNQIVACTYYTEVPPWGNPITGGQDVAPRQCYWGTEHDLTVQGEQRLDKWADDDHDAPKEDYKPLIATGYDNFIDYWQDYREWYGEICLQIPLIGGITIFGCVDDPANISRANVWGMLYPYLPLSSTEDKIGTVTTGVTSDQPSAAEGNGVSLVEIKLLPDELTLNPGGEDIDKWFRNFDLLYFPHMLENTQLADLLQNTYAPHSENPLAKIQGEIISTNNQENFDNFQRCEVLNTRANQGDNLYGEYERGDPPIDAREGNIKAKVEYTAEFICDYREEFSISEFNSCVIQRQCAERETCLANGGAVVGTGDGPFNCETTIDLSTGTIVTRPGWVTCDLPDFSPAVVQRCIEESTTVNKCEKTVMTATNIEVNTPLIEKSWRQLVQSDMSIFKKIFPALGPDAPVEEFEHIPGETRARYSASSLGANIATTTSPQTFAGDPTDNVPGSSARIYFPYLGGIQKYFLSGVQCALRPLEAECGETITTSGITSPTPTQPNCDPYVPDVDLGPWAGQVVTKEQLEDWAARGVQPYPDLVSIENMALCYNHIVGEAISAGYDPAFALTIWAEESWASNYEALESAGRLPVYDMGCTVSGYRQNDFTNQLSCFTNLLRAYTSPSHWSFDTSDGMQCRDNDGCTDFREWAIIFADGFAGCRADAITQNPQFVQRVQDWYPVASLGRALSFEPGESIMMCQ